MWQQHRYSACSRQASAEILGIQAERSSRDTLHADSMSRDNRNAGSDSKDTQQLEQRYSECRQRLAGAWIVGMQAAAA